MVEFKRKKVDEDWKKQAVMEKEKISQEEESNFSHQQASFEHLLSMLVTQAFLQLGEMENPVTGYKTLDLAGAKFSIDMLKVLQEKTQGNLTDEEEQAMKHILYQLQMSYVAKAGVGS
ncbi:MAG: DUF1844 domain-containing protein [Candidatus Brocadiae bacterium]|nr:DUF1844 domain-containing protein [Candidatus Brocadiia bacterium]